MQNQDITPINEIKRSPPHGMEMEGRQSLKVRDDRIDSVKYWLIVLVIMIHVFNKPEFSDSAACVALWHWAYIFCMPLFVFISGYFSRKKEKKDFLPSIWKLLEPLIIFQIIALLFYVKKSISVGTILTPWHVLWYLLSLIYWRLMLQFIPYKILKHKKIIIIGAFCLSIFSGLLPLGKILSIQRTLTLTPFFFLGYFMKNKNIYIHDKYKPYSIVFLVVILTALLFIPHSTTDGFYLSKPYASIYGAVVRMMIFVISVPMSIAFVNICYRTPWIARQGRMSMQYYIYHALIIFPLMSVLDKMNIPMSFITATLITTGITLGIGILLRLSYIRALTNPSSLFCKLLKSYK